MNRSLFLAVALSALTAACGFQLKGHQDFAFKRLYISGAPNPAMQTRLERMVRGGSNTAIVKQAAQADAVLSLSESRGSGVLSLNQAGQVQEYVLSDAINYRLTAADGTELIPLSTISVNRAMTYSDQYALAKAQEAELLYRDMQNDAVDQLMRRLALVRTLHPSAPVPAVRPRAPLPTPPL